MASKECVICLWPEANQCARCKSAHYCSKKCQQSDWPSHKLVCKVFSEMLPRPSSKHYKCILFPTATNAPEPVWVDFSSGFPRINESTSWFSSEASPHIEDTSIPFSFRTRMILKTSLYLTNRALFQFDESPINESLMAAIKPYCLSPDLVFKGTVLAYAVKEYTYEELLALEAQDEENLEEFRRTDITLDDLRHIIDFSIRYESRDRMDFSSVTVPGPNIVHAALFNCAEASLRPIGKLLPMVVPARLPEHLGSELVVGPGEISSLSKLVGMPLRLFQCTPKAFQAKSKNHNNTYAALLMMEVDVTKTSWGKVPDEWRYPGDVYVKLEEDDGKGLDSQVALAFARFVLEKVQPQVAKALELGTAKAKEDVVKFVCKKNFDSYKMQPAGYY